MPQNKLFRHFFVDTYIMDLQSQMERISSFLFIQDGNIFILFIIFIWKEDRLSHHSHSHLKTQKRAAVEKIFSETEKTPPF